jgi:hypothetical protein
VQKGEPIMPLTPPERRANARGAALHRSATSVGADISAPARKAFLDGFLPPAAPGVSEEERQRQAAAALRERMVRLGQLSGRARRKAREAAEAQAELDDAIGRHVADEAV